MPSLSQKNLRPPGKMRASQSVPPPRLRSPGQDMGFNSRARCSRRARIQQTSPAPASAVGMMATGRSPARAQQIGDHGLALVPVLGGGPAIVHHQHQRPVARQSSARGPAAGSASATIRSAAASKRSSSSHQGVCAGVCSSSLRPSSSRSGGNSDAARLRRRDVQQPPQHRQRDQRRQNPGRAETQLLQNKPMASQRHGPMAACSAISAVCGA